MSQPLTSSARFGVGLLSGPRIYNGAGDSPAAHVPINPIPHSLLSAVCCLLSAVCCLLSAVCCLLSAVCLCAPPGDLSSARAQAASLSDVAAAGQALRGELEAELQETQLHLAALTAQLTDSNTVRPGPQGIWALGVAAVHNMTLAWGGMGEVPGCRVTGCP
jgi:hypothetical protein